MTRSGGAENRRRKAGIGVIGNVALTRLFGLALAPMAAPFVIDGVGATGEA